MIFGFENIPTEYGHLGQFYWHLPLDFFCLLLFTVLFGTLIFRLTASGQSNGKSNISGNWNSRYVIQVLEMVRTNDESLGRALRKLQRIKDVDINTCRLENWYFSLLIYWKCLITYDAMHNASLTCRVRSWFAEFFSKLTLFEWVEHRIRHVSTKTMKERSVRMNEKQRSNLKQLIPIAACLLQPMKINRSNYRQMIESIENQQWSERTSAEAFKFSHTWWKRLWPQQLWNCMMKRGVRANDKCGKYAIYKSLAQWIMWIKSVCSSRLKTQLIVV